MESNLEQKQPKKRKLFEEDSDEPCLVDDTFPDRAFESDGVLYTNASAPCSSEDTHTLLGKIIQQAVEDYVMLKNTSLRDKNWTEEWGLNAKEFLFGDNYSIDYGGLTLDFRSIMSYLIDSDDVNMELIREQLDARKTLSLNTPRRGRTTELEPELEEDSDE